MRSTLLGGASTFAHLAGIGVRGRRGARAEDDDRRDDEARGGKRSRAEDDDEDDEPKGKRSRAEDDDDQDQAKGKGKTSRRAEDDDEDDDAPKGKRSRAADDDEDDEPKGRKSRRAADDDDEDEPKGRRSRAAEDDDDEDDDDDKNEMNGRSAAASARRRERARCAAIFGSRHAAGNVELAASLAFETTMTRREAIAVMKRQAEREPTTAHDVRSERRSRNPDLGPGGRQERGGAAAATASWDAALAKAGVPARK